MKTTTIKQTTIAKSINAADAAAFAKASFTVDSALTAREIISKTTAAWRKAGIKIGSRNCPNRAVLKTAFAEYYEVKRLPDVMYCVALAINEGIAFSTNKATMASKAKAAGKVMAENRNKTGKRGAKLPAGKAATTAKPTTPSKAVVTAPGKFTTTGSVLDALADMVAKIKDMAGPELWARTMKSAPVGTGSALDELLRAQAKD